MSVENKVVAMGLDASNFLRNVGPVLSTLGTLRGALNFSGATKGLDEVNDSMNKLSFSGMSNGIGDVTNKFSVLNEIAIGFFRNLGSRIENVVSGSLSKFTSKIKELSFLEQAGVGMAKYADKTTAVQTIMSATEQTWEKSAETLGYTGTQMEFVSDQLQRLNWFSDETSYSFSDMTNNIGKFTSAGVQLEDAVTAMEGISVWAAKSGAGIQGASRAMYNLSQAMSVGSVKLMDWRSIENANMATMEFKETAIKAAEELGTLKKVGDGLWKTLDGHEVSVKNFNEALQDGWFSSEVLMSALDEYGRFTTFVSEAMEDERFAAIDTTSEFIEMIDVYNEAEDKEAALIELSKKHGVALEDLRPVLEELSKEEYKLGISAFKAAQEAKTFQEAIDATKDAVSTGWMKSAEIVFGNYEEAKVLWTALANDLWDIFASGAKGRNDFLEKVFKDLGGRKVMFETYTNIMTTLKNVINEVKMAFAEIFPPKTAKDVIAIMRNFRNFTSALVEVDEESGKIANGKFRSLMDDVFKPLVNVFKTLGSAIKDVFKIIKNVATNAKLVWSYIFPNATVMNGAEGAIGLLQKIADKVKDFTGYLRKATNTTKFWLEFNTKAHPILDGFKKGIEGLSGALAWIGEKALSAWTTLKEFFTGVKESTADIELSGNRLDRLSGIFEGFKNVIKAVWEELKSFAPVFEAIGNIFKEVFTSLATGLKKFAESGNFSDFTDIFSVGIMATLYMALKKIPTVLGSFSEALESMQGRIQAQSITDIAKAVAILAASAVVISLIDSNKLNSSMTAILALVAGLSLVMRTLTDSFSMFGQDGGLFKAINNLSKAKAMEIAVKSLEKMATAILILSAAMLVMSAIDPASLWRSLLVTSVLIAELTAVMVVLAKMAPKMSMGSSALIMMAGAVSILASTVVKLSKEDFNSLGTGMAVISVLLLELTVSLMLLKKSLGGGAALTLAAVGILAVAGALKVMASIDNAGTALYSFAVSLLTLAVVLNVMSGAIPGALALTIASVGLIAMAGAVKILSTSTEGMGKTLGLLAGLFGILAVGLTLMIASLPGAIALVVFAGALAILIPGLVALGKIKASTLFKGLGLLAAVLISVGVASLLLVPGALALAAFAIALTVISVSVGVLAVSLTALTAALTVLSAVGGIQITALIALIKTFINGLASLLPVIFKLVKNLFGGILDTLIFLTPKLYEFLKEFLVGLGQLLIEVIPVFVEALTVLVLSLLESFKLLIPAIAETAVIAALDTVAAVMKALTDRIPDLVDQGFKLLVAIIDGFATAIEKNAEDIRNAVIKLGKSIWSAFLTFFGIGKKKNIVRTDSGKVINDVLRGLGDAVTAAWEKIKDIGKRIIDGIKAGIEKAKGALKKAAHFVVSVVTGETEDGLDINSPSRVFAEYGKFIDMGLAEGMEDNVKVVEKASGSLTKSTMKGMASAISSISDSVSNDLDFNPTIRPVLDLSEIQNGGRAISGLLNDGLDLSLRNAQSANVFGGVLGDGSTGMVSGGNIIFNQNNYSPKALSAVDIYRQTRSQFAQMKGLVNGI